MGFNRLIARCWIFTSLFLLLCGAKDAAAKAVPCTMAQPPLVEDGCEGEGCGSLEYSKAIQTVDLHKEPSKSSPIVDQIRRCEPLSGFSPKLVIQRYGRGTIAKTPLEGAAQEGDTVVIRSYRGEGFFAVCIGDHEVELSEVMGNSPGDLRNIHRPQTENWIALESPRGIKGFAPASENFYMGHYDFAKDQMCPEDRTGSPSTGTPQNGDKGLTQTPP